ncbi:PHP domain-containing protein [candidate division WOR-3 bacterium]|nr:PHP domain-containing protein [candidate division WOR-3 bacterium]
MLKCLRADLHIHTCLSPCADLTMSPLRIVQAALARRLDVIAICDHNSAENVQAAMNAARGTDLSVCPAMEITSAEEVHVIGLFADAGAVLNMQKKVYDNLSSGKNDERLFGEQIIVNEADEIMGYSDRLLIGATSISIEEVIAGIHELGGLAIASHIDREAYSILGQLGFIPENLPLDALEVSSRIESNQAKHLFSQISAHPVITSSDAHNLDEIGKGVTIFQVERPTIDEMRHALRNENGRRVLLEK